MQTWKIVMKTGKKNMIIAISKGEKDWKRQNDSVNIYLFITILVKELLKQITET